MKRVVYSNITKWIMALIIVAAVFVGCYQITDYFDQSYQKEEHLFEPEDLLTSEAEMKYSNRPYRNILQEINEIGANYMTEEEMTQQASEANLDGDDPVYYDFTDNWENVEEASAMLAKELDDSYYDYYIYLVGEDGQVLFDQQTLETEAIEGNIKNSKYGYYYSYDKNESRVLDGTSQLYYDSLAELSSVSVVYIQPKQALYNIWMEQKSAFIQLVYRFAIATLVTLFALIWLIATVGRNGKGELTKCYWFDRIWMEIWLVVVMVPCALGCFSVEAWIWNYDWPVMRILCSVVMALAMASLAGILLIEVKNLKNHTFWKRSIIFRMIAGVGRRMGFFIGQLFKKKRVFTLVAGFAVYILFVALCHLSAGMVVVAILVTGVIAYGMVYVLHELIRIKQGVKEISEGRMDLEIKKSKIKMLNEHIYHINHLRDGLKVAVDKEVVAQKMQTELITNVSHDLKTPLTSIINYSELLCGLELEPEEARDYAKIVQQKSLRLKTLTTNLFEFTKATSGAEKFKVTEIDLGLLTNQVLGELEQEMNMKNFQYKISVPEKKAMILADGGKLQRVLENLVGNALNYSLEGTRIFITLNSEEDQWMLTIKNTSAYPIDFDVEEITKRFVRGDESRTTEGNGLGLAIAKSYTEGCGGVLQLEADGDLFKASVIFEKQMKEQ